MKKIFFPILISALAFTSCKKDEVTTTATKGPITIHFDNIAGSADLALNTGTYTNSIGQSFTVSKFDYYISNIQLKKADGTIYTVPQDSSYFLVKESDESTQEIDLNNVPAGDYTGITFTVGVDSARCTADISKRTGVLDPAAGGSGMYWTWNSGYIFLKLEGSSPASTMGDITYHIGGFGGMTSATINNIKTIQLAFPSSSSAQVKEGRHPEAHLLVDVKKVIDGTTAINFATSPMIMFNAASVDVANNYKNMFTVDHVHND